MKGSFSAFGILKKSAGRDQLLAYHDPQNLQREENESDPSWAVDVHVNETCSAINHVLIWEAHPTFDHDTQSCS